MFERQTVNGVNLWRLRRGLKIQCHQEHFQEAFRSRDPTARQGTGGLLCKQAITANACQLANFYGNFVHNQIFDEAKTISSRRLYDNSVLVQSTYAT
jgi:hypothetical protein